MFQKDKLGLFLTMHQEAGLLHRRHGFVPRVLPRLQLGRDSLEVFPQLARPRRLHLEHPAGERLKVLDHVAKHLAAGAALAVLRK